MRAGLFPKLAADSMKKNRRLYAPYLLTCAVMIMMYYILDSLSRLELLDQMRGGGTLQLTLQLGSWVIGLFSLLFLFYTHSFLFRRRKKELGLYNVLGMEKKHICRILFWETLISAAIALGSGLVLGVGLSKLAELGLVNLIRGDVSFDFHISPESLGRTAAVFGAIFLLGFLQGVWQVFRSNPVELLRSENVGEKQPKANWVLAVAGALLLAAAYWLAVSIQEPLQAMVWFFVAVLLVILGTYLLFISGSVALCRLLQKNKRYYYKTNHFVSVSSMVYRMKRNGAGLASICILGTMVLVMLTSTSCLYMGVEDSLRAQHPWDLSVRVGMNQDYDTGSAYFDRLAENIQPELDKMDVTQERVFRFIATGGCLEDGVLNLNQEGQDGRFTYVYLLDLADYNRMSGTEVTLEPWQILADGVEGELHIADGKTYTVVGPLSGRMDRSIRGWASEDSLVLVVPDLKTAYTELRAQVQQYEFYDFGLQWACLVDLNDSDEAQMALQDRVQGILCDVTQDADFAWSYSTWSIAADRGDFYSSYGGLFFLGILLSAVFLFAAVLIIYYKQISEGFEDQSRFAIMRKVGMTGREIRKSINSQMLTVFFLPLFGAVLHLAFAFPMLRRILILFNAANLPLLLATAGGSVLIFAMFYLLVYRLTSNAYYSIVNEH